MFRLGAIGIDSSHLPEFTKRIKTLNESDVTRCLVTQLWTDGRHDLPADQVEKWRKRATELGVQSSATIDELLDNVDGVMVLAVNGNRHLKLSLPAIERSLPTYIDKPLTCNVKEAKQLLEVARARNARCYSASSLRFASEVANLPRGDLGKLLAVDAFGPGELNPAMEGLFYYGVHTIEMVDAIWGPGVKRVSAITLPDRDLLDMEYRDGRYARLRMERRGCYEFGATIHGERKVHQFRVDFASVYDRLVQGMVGFFEGGEPPTQLRDIVENVAVMEA
ncbi:MAG: Gfo/Idh/MocA family protein, partial [Gammaproteobacteria bacterium]